MKFYKLLILSDLNYRHFLSAFRFKTNGRIWFGGIYKVLEALAQLRIVHYFFPFASISFHHKLHLSLQIGANTQRILNNYLAQVIYSTFHFIQPGGREVKWFGR